jgi:hypothetical protein
MQRRVQATSSGGIESNSAVLPEQQLTERLRSHAESSSSGYDSQQPNGHKSLAVAPTCGINKALCCPGENSSGILPEGGDMR